MRAKSCAWLAAASSAPAAPVALPACAFLGLGQSALDAALRCGSGDRRSVRRSSACGCRLRLSRLAFAGLPPSTAYEPSNTSAASHRFHTWVASGRSDSRATPAGSCHRNAPAPLAAPPAPGCPDGLVGSSSSRKFAPPTSSARPDARSPPLSWRSEHVVAAEEVLRQIVAPGPAACACGQQHVQHRFVGVKPHALK